MNTMGSLPGGKAAGGMKLTTYPIYCCSQECVELYLCFPCMSSWYAGTLPSPLHYKIVVTVVIVIITVAISSWLLPSAFIMEINSC
jgi:hypothetical protein